MNVATAGTPPRLRATSRMNGVRPLGLTTLLTLLFLGFALLPPARGNPRLAWTFGGLAVVLFAWQLLLWVRARRGRQGFPLEVAVVKAHWVQAAVQGSIYVYWGWFWPQVWPQAPLIVAQVVFLYVFGALLAWSRGRTWQVGFGALPIIFSTNLLLWFRQDWFLFQFLMVAAGALGKEYITWQRDGRRSHIFNPSVFGQALFAVVLIATGTTERFTMGSEMASSFESVPHILLYLFALGLIVQYHFSVTLITLAAASVLCLFNLAYTGVTGVYFFTTLNIGATIFLGLHLLVTDPSTSPRTNVGRIAFGALYGAGYIVLFRLFDSAGIPVFWDKLLPVPILNLAVPLLDRWARARPLGALNRRWETALRPRALNFVHMACWTTLFTAMVTTGFVEGRHEGRSIAFWRQAYDEGRHGAGARLLELVRYRAAAGSGEACNMLGKLYIEGKLLAKDEAAAAFYFAKACELGDAVGCQNVVGQFLFERRANAPEDVTRAIEHVEGQCPNSQDGFAPFLMGFAYETGSGRPRQPLRAIELYEQACTLGNQNACQALARLRVARGARAGVGGQVTETPARSGASR